MSNEVNDASLAVSVDLIEALLLELAAQSEPVSLARLSKRLRVRQSSLLRCIAYLGDEVIGTQAGPGLVQVQQIDDRTLCSLTEKGRMACALQE
ncbi:hypothetical protein AAKU64_000974 [Undibacterium sp. GrIS 1.8]|uniref:hypothetical protein n=1 Tax=unclassified Undibacterium TaxID=2630295 RepID=UPI003390EC47